MKPTVPRSALPWMAIGRLCVMVSTPWGASMHRWVMYEHKKIYRQAVPDAVASPVTHSCWTRHCVTSIQASTATLKAARPRSVIA